MEWLKTIKISVELKNQIKRMLENINDYENAVLTIKDFKQTNKKFLYLNAHCLYSSLSDKRILNDEEFRDEVEYILLFYSDTAQREEKLKNHLSSLL